MPETFTRCGGERWDFMSMTDQDRELFVACQQLERSVLAVQDIATRGMPPALSGIYTNRVHALLRALLDELKGGPTREIAERALSGTVPPTAPRH